VPTKFPLLSDFPSVLEGVPDSVSRIRTKIV